MHFIRHRNTFTLTERNRETTTIGSFETRGRTLDIQSAQETEGQLPAESQPEPTTSTFC